MRTGAQHVDYVCQGHDGDPYYNWNCQFCEGGLWACTVCGGFEGAMPTHCPGSRMSSDTEDWVYEGIADYRWGRWIDRPSRFSPAWWGRHRDRLSLVENWNGRIDIFGRKVKR